LPSLYTGRLSIIYDQAGKARIVAITNWVVQILFYPLHIFLFTVLKSIPQDGTFNQMAPLEALTLYAQRNPGQYFSSFDLSAATDRLPLKLQIQILNIAIPRLGSL